MPIIRVEMFEGRPVEKKRQLVEVLTEDMCRVTGCSPESVYVIIDDVEKENWGMKGALSSDLFPDKGGAK